MEDTGIKNSAIDPAEVRLDELAASVFMRKSHDLGYPLNQKSRLIGFYRWLSGSGLNLAMVNNAGDPFDAEKGHAMNTLQFEREVIEYAGDLYGFDKDDLWGIVTFSGTDGNNNGIYFGAKYLENITHQKPVMYVSDAAHYSSRRLADLQNLELRLIPSDVHGCMIPEEFDKALVDGRPALAVYAMGTTFKGGIDDIDALNAVLEKHPSITAYRHIDAALFGGYLPFTKYKDVLDRRLHHFDSIAVSGHKFFGIDETGGFYITTMNVRNNQDPYNISYLDCSMPMINCSRSAMTPLKLWWIFQHTSREEFEKQASEMLEGAAWLKGEMDSIGWPAWLEPMSNTVYFKRPPKSIAEKYNTAPDYDERLGGELSHIVVMQHATGKQLQSFVDGLKKSADNSVNRI